MFNHGLNGELVARTNETTNMLCSSKSVSRKVSKLFVNERGRVHFDENVIHQFLCHDEC